MEKLRRGPIVQLTESKNGTRNGFLRIARGAVSPAGAMEIPNDGSAATANILQKERGTAHYDVHDRSRLTCLIQNILKMYIPEIPFPTIPRYAPLVIVVLAFELSTLATVDHRDNYSTSNFPFLNLAS